MKISMTITICIGVVDHGVVLPLLLDICCGHHSKYCRDIKDDNNNDHSASHDCNNSHH